MRILRRSRTAASVVSVLLLISVGAIYFASQLPEYSPCHLDEQFTSFDPNVWEVGGMKNYSISNGMLTLFDSTNATHYFITNPKWRSVEIPETKLRGRVEIFFEANPAPNRSVAVAATDSWRTYAYEDMLAIDLKDRPNRTLHQNVELGFGWHSLEADTGTGALELSLDGRTMLRADNWMGNLTRVELGTSLPTIGALKVQGMLLIQRVKADLRPLAQSEIIQLENCGESPDSIVQKTTQAPKFGKL